MPLRPHLPSLAALLCASSLALAAPPPAPAPAAAPPAPAPAVAPLSATLTGDAKAAYEAGKLLFDDKDYVGAATKYRAAYKESHDARLLYNIATCEKELRHYARAAGLLDRFVSDAGALVPPEFIDQARTTLAALRQFYSPVKVNVSPPDAHVSLDGEDIGAPPFTAPIFVDLGKHQVHAERDGYLPSDTTLDVTGQGEMGLAVTLKERPTTAQLAVNPSDKADTVTLDDTLVGTGPWHGDVKAGSHQLRVTAPGKKPYLLDLEVAAGEHRSIDVTLEDEHKALIWPWIVGGVAVLAAGGTVGGYFLLKPSAAPAAPPSDAQLPTVHLSSVRLRAR